MSDPPASGAHDAGVLQPFDYACGAARQIMLAHPPYLLARRYGASAQHILIVGFGTVGQALAREFLISSVSLSPEAMMITVIDPEMARIAPDFIARQPALADHVDFAFIAGDLHEPGPSTIEQVRARRAQSPVCAVYVAIPDENASLDASAALRAIAACLDLFRAPIFVFAPTGISAPVVRQGVGLVGRAETPRDAPSDLLRDLALVAFGSSAAAQDGAGWLEPERDGQARRFHDSFRALKAAAFSPSTQPWDALPEEFRASNRRVAAHVRAKLDAAGYDLNAWLAAPADGRRTHEIPPGSSLLRNLEPAEMDRLAALEHRRWFLDRLLDGWRFGRPRDDLRKLHPDLVPYDELDEAAREKDRGNIRMTARLLQDMERGVGSP